jgi:hypothetical protein
MSDVYEEVTSKSYGGRIVESLKGVVVGIVLILVAGGLLFWNEGRAIKRLRALEEGQGAVVSVKVDQVSPKHDGKLVHLSGMATTDEELHDATFGVRAKAIKLIRDVQMYQWTERKESKTKKELGGSSKTRTKYYYEKKWSSKAVDSSRFKKSAGHSNPSMPHHGQTFTAREVRLGGYKLSPSLIGKMDQYKALGVTEKAFEEAKPAVRDSFRRHGNGFYKGASPASPDIGDIKVEFRVVEPQTISLVARQTGDTFEPYATKAGGTIELLRPGTLSSDAMFEKAIEENANLTWILRLAGVVVMIIGFAFVFSPLSVLADVVPFLGNLVSMGTGLVAVILGLSLSFFAIAIGWVFYRPYIGIPLLVAAIGLPLLAMLRKSKQRTPVPVPARRTRGAQERRQTGKPRHRFTRRG